jgi:hypothetical protein
MVAWVKGAFLKNREMGLITTGSPKTGARELFMPSGFPGIASSKNRRAAYP